MKFRAVLIVGVSALLWGSPRVAAHHSFATAYDETKPIQVKGTVSKVEWTNPHAHVYIDVKVGDRKNETWNFEMASPNILARNGFTRDTLNVGDEITVLGYLARKAERMAVAGSLTDASGKPLFALPLAESAR